MDATLTIINTVITAVVLPWLVVIERRLSRMEGYMKALLKYNGAGDRDG